MNFFLWLASPEHTKYDLNPLVWCKLAGFAESFFCDYHEDSDIVDKSQIGGQQRKKMNKKQNLLRHNIVKTIHNNNFHSHYSSALALIPGCVERHECFEWKQMLSERSYILLGSIKENEINKIKKVWCHVLAGACRRRVNSPAALLIWNKASSFLPPLQPITSVTMDSGNFKTWSCQGPSENIHPSREQNRYCCVFVFYVGHFHLF